MNRIGSHPDLVQQLDKSAYLWTPPGSARKRFDPHDFPGYGSYDVRTTPDNSEIEHIDESLHQHESRKVLLGELEATAISGNDILSSTFYVSGLVTLSAGKLAPLCLALVGVVLYLFRGIYHETVMALPCNGGTYNILLNCTSKQVASTAAVFAVISYITTGVVSALEAIAYLQTVLPKDTIDTQLATIVLLLIFCILTNIGIQESAVVAKFVFVAHVATLSILTMFGILFLVFNPQRMFDNWTAPYPELDVAGEMVEGTFWAALFYGFSSAMLGVSGFETSSQFVEEQAPGVFPKTLRNMWAGVMWFNPVLSMISFAALDIEEIYQHKDTVLARTAHVIGHWIQTCLDLPEHWQIGRAFSILVSVDAFVVLAAALLTGYVGINGLIRRMSMDRCLPQFLLKTNPITGTDSFILVGFFLLCASQVVVLNSDVEALGAVYCFAFLSVMAIFAYGNILLKIKRPTLPREVTVSWINSVLGLAAVVTALLGNILGKPEYLTFFFVYFMIVGVLVLMMFQRVAIMRLFYKILKSNRNHVEENDDPPSDDEESTGIPETIGEKLSLISPLTTMPSEISLKSCLSYLSLELKKVQDTPFVFWWKHDDLHLLNKAILYIQENEQTHKVIICHCVINETNTRMMTEHVKLIDLLYPRVKISMLFINANFGAATVEWVSRALGVPLNAMFISCPDETFAMKVSQLRGMRIITTYH